MFTLMNCGHKHETVYEAKVCIGLVRPPVKAYSPPVEYKDQPGTMSDKQERLLRNFFKATNRHLVDGNGRRLSMNQASKLIDDFKAGRITVEPIQDAPKDPKLEFIRSMIDTLPDGRYAVRADADEPYRFLRLSTGGQRSRFRDARKVQTQHSEELINRAILWPSGRWTTYTGFKTDDLLLAMADPHGCAIAYGREIGRCCRCGKVLTDERSRHYGIGPECEKFWPHIITRVDEETALERA